jgi:peptide/nickel transport system substrate-binding protein
MANRADSDDAISGASTGGEHGAGSSRRDVLRGALAGGAILATGGLAACGASSPSASPTPSASGPRPRRGGNLRVGILGGSTSDTLDANREVTQPDAIRIMALYNSLVRLDTKAQVVNDLAAEMTPNKDATVWTVKLKPGITFHNGKDLTANDVIFTFRRIANPKAPLDGATGLAPVDLAGLKALDPLTVQVPMTTPYASFPEQISAAYNFGIVPVGYDPARPVGTGPFMYHSFTPGQQSVFVRNPHYFKPGLPHLDRLTIIDFSADTAAFNALQGGQVDVYSQATLSLVNQIKGSSTLNGIGSRRCRLRQERMGWRRPGQGRLHAAGYRAWRQLTPPREISAAGSPSLPEAAAESGAQSRSLSRPGEHVSPPWAGPATV